MSQNFCLTLIIICVFCHLAMFSSAAQAQDDNRLGLDPDYIPRTTSEPLCFDVRSDIDHIVYAQIISNYYQLENGTWARHRHNFKIEKGSVHPVCTTGPFYKTSQIMVKVKSLIPILTCFFDLQNGNQTLRFYYKFTKDDVKRLWANCDIIYPMITDP